MKKQIIVVVMLVIVVGAGMFFAGKKFEAKKIAKIQSEEETEQRREVADTSEQDIQTQDRLGIISGKVTAKDDVSIMIKMKDETLKKIIYSNSTSVRKTDIVGISEIAQGQQMAVRGKDNSDGTLSAMVISIAPQKKQ